MLGMFEAGLFPGVKFASYHLCRLFTYTYGIHQLLSLVVGFSALFKPAHVQLNLVGTSARNSELGPPSSFQQLRYLEHSVACWP
jgi:hypothetical protein